MNQNQTVKPETVYLNTPTLLSIPPKEEELNRLEKHKDWLRKNNKKEIILCCNNIRNFIQGAINIGLTESELKILKEALHLHPYDRFGGNKFRIEGKIEVNVDSLVKEVLEISTLFSEKIQKYFLGEFYSLVQNENKNPAWEITLGKFNRKWEELTFDLIHKMKGNFYDDSNVREILNVIREKGSLLIHKDLPKHYFSLLKTMEVHDLVEKKGIKYELLPLGYEILTGESFRKLRDNIGVRGINIKGLKEMVGRNEFDQVIAILKADYNENTDVYDQLILVQSQLANHNNSKIKGLISQEQERIEFNSIAHAILEVIKKLD
jgi:hypothetical protein